MRKTHNFFKGARVYLSGPMDFVASREREKRYGWRVRVSQFLKRCGATVFDPWNKPEVRGLLEYGREDASTVREREGWTFARGPAGSKARARLAEHFWSTMHIDLRMVDISDFVIAYVPTNIYSVGTVHEIVTARQQHKPVLFVSPPVSFPSLEELKATCKGNPAAEAAIENLEIELPVKPNPEGIPSLWYMPLIGSESFFDGFGFCRPEYHESFPSWKKKTPLDRREEKSRPKDPLLPFLSSLASGKVVPRRWNSAKSGYESDDDWLLLEESLEQ